MKKYTEFIIIAPKGRRVRIEAPNKLEALKSFRDYYPKVNISKILMVYGKKKSNRKMARLDIRVL